MELLVIFVIKPLNIFNKGYWAVDIMNLRLWYQGKVYSMDVKLNDQNR